MKREAASPPTVKELEDARKYAKANISLKEAVKGADRAFRDLEGLYEQVAKKRPYSLGIGLTPPLPINTSAVEILPLDYPHMARSERQSKRVMVTAPLTWIVTYAGPESLARRAPARPDAPPSPARRPGAQERPARASRGAELSRENRDAAGVR